MIGEFSVYQFFPNETWERVREGVNAEEAVNAAQHYCNSVGGQIGTTVRVIITNGSDECCFEWKRGEGIVFPPQLAARSGAASGDLHGD